MSKLLTEDQRPLKIVIVTRRFWPMAGASEMGLVSMAVELQRQGHAVEVLTPRWDREWPTHFQLQTIPVQRIARPNQGPWGSFRFQRQLLRSILERSPVDAIIVFGLNDESLTKAKPLADTPIVLRVDYRNTPYSQFAQWTNRKRAGIAENVNAFFADSEYSADQLLAAGLPSDKVHVLSDPVTGDHELRSTVQQVNARTAISNAHPVLSIDPTQPLVVTGAPLDDDGGISDLLDAWALVLERLPKAKLWLLGDGPEGSRIWNKICSMNLVYSVIMPGYFDDLAPVFAAADLYVHPLQTGRACHVLTQAMNCRLACVATETSFTRYLVERNVTGLVCPAGNSSALAEAIVHGLNDRDLCRRLGRAAHDKAQESFASEKIVERLLQFIRRPSPTSSVSHP